MLSRNTFSLSKSAEYVYMSTPYKFQLGVTIIIIISYLCIFSARIDELSDDPPLLLCQKRERKSKVKVLSACMTEECEIKLENVIYFLL